MWFIWCPMVQLSVFSTASFIFDKYTSCLPYPMVCSEVSVGKLYFIDKNAILAQNLIHIMAITLLKKHFLNLISEVF